MPDQLAVEALGQGGAPVPPRGGWFADAWNFTVTSVDGREVTVGTLVVFLAVVVLGVWASKIVARALAAVLRRRTRVSVGAAAAIQTVAFYVLLSIVVLLALKIVNVPLTIFAVVGGALAIGVGFGSQNIANNFISGLIMLVEQPVRVGDLIEIGDVVGVVRHIGARSTRVTTPDNVEMVIPNSSFLESNVKNWTLADDKVRARVEVGVAYGSPVREVERLMLQAASENEHVLADPPPKVLFSSFGDNALVFHLYFFVRIGRLFERLRLESDLRFRIDELFREARVCIAFPQRDVHLDTARPLEVRVVGANPAGRERDLH